MFTLAFFTRLSRSMARHSRRLTIARDPIYPAPLPQYDKSNWFRLFRFRSPLLSESHRFLFLGLLRCFTSPGIAVPPYELG